MLGLSCGGRLWMMGGVAKLVPRISRNLRRVLVLGSIERLCLI